MCGIAGVTDKKILDKDKVVRSMNAAIIHRGPDDDGFLVDDYAGLGMRRLAIIDIAGGSQPIRSDDGKLVLFFNGEIYNYLELKKELASKGISFKTESDTEVVLKMYEMYGTKMLTRLRGMFAFAIYNTENHELILARDIFGIKPLYYLKEGEGIKAFSSEIKSFYALPGFHPEINDRAVYNYLSYQYNPLEESFFKGVFKLSPGHFIKADLKTGNYDIERYWKFEFNKSENLDEEETLKKIFRTMEDSVAHHMIADVPVGSFLSGGIDSSIIATLMQKIRGDKKIKTFTVGFDTLTEAMEASETSNALETDHTEIIVTQDEYFKALPKAVWHFDEPVADPSAIGLYFLAREARKHVTVVLSGEGSDEFFGGYNIYLEPFARRKVAFIPRFLLRAVGSLPFNFFGKNYLSKAGMKLEDWYIGNASIFKPKEVEHLWKKEIEKPFPIENIYDEVRGESESTQMQYIDINTWLIGDILAKADKMTMAHSLELRVPFLDKEVANLASTLPDRFKWKNGATKYLLRKAFQGVIPESTRNRKKLGFPTPLRSWLTKDREDIYGLILENQYIKEHMDIGYVKGIIRSHVEKKADNSRKIYLLLMLALWYNTFIKLQKP